jgi:asparagine synthase (glutamine-hydrolysing)
LLGDNVCGIVGQVRPRGDQVERQLVERMCAGLEHRGPDVRGIALHGRAGLGIQRLRVIDPATGDQPIHNEDRSVAVVLNGEIYNFRELRAELQARGHTFATAGDTEVIVHLYEEYGADCVEHLHGMFAFAVWDTRRQRLLLARDRIGKKPLHFALRDGTLSFASELGALLQDPGIPRDVNRAAIDRYLAFGYVPTPMSAYSAVRKLPPAHTLVLEEGSVSLRRYWQLDYGTKLEGVSTEEIGERVRAGIRAAVRRRLVADVPVGAFLSGGIDSSAVVAAMAEASTEPVKTFTIGFESERFNELPQARRMAERLGTHHEEYVVRPDAAAMLPKIVRHHGEPFGDPSAIPCFHLAQITRKHVTVALNGDGGDESFGGYTRYVANRVAGRLDSLPAPLRRALTAAGRRLPAGGDVSSLRNRARRLTASMALDAPGRYAGYVGSVPTANRLALYPSEYAAAIAAEAPADDVIRAAWEMASGEDITDVMLQVDVSTYLLDDLIAKIDISSMAYGLEARSPFLDHELMELAASIPANLKVRGSEKKWILRDALRGWLPDEVLDRPKQGFSVPENDWLRGDLAGWAREVLLDPRTIDRGYFDREAVRGLVDRHAAGADEEGRRVWTLLALELWHRECVDQAPAPSTAAAPPTTPTLAAA